MTGASPCRRAARTRVPLSLSACLAPASPSPGSSRGPWSATRFITEGDIDVKQVIQASGVMPYEPYGFTNCVRFKDVLYLSGISAMDLQGRVIGDDIETQTVHTYQNIEREFHRGSGEKRSRLCCGPQDDHDPPYVHQCDDRHLCAHGARASARGAVHCSGTVADAGNSTIPSPSRSRGATLAL